MRHLGESMYLKPRLFSIHFAFTSNFFLRFLQTWWPSMIGVQFVNMVIAEASLTCHLWDSACRQGGPGYHQQRSIIHIPKALLHTVLTHIAGRNTAIICQTHIHATTKTCGCQLEEEDEEEEERVTSTSVTRWFLNAAGNLLLIYNR